MITNNDLQKQQKEFEVKNYPDQFETYGKLLIRRFDERDKYDTKTLYLLKVWRGKANKPLAYYWYKSGLERETAIVRYKESEDRAMKFMADQRVRAETERVLFKSKLQVGSILYSSWGYDQTNIDFYQIIKKKGDFVWIRELKQRVTESVGWCSDMVAPLWGDFTDDSKLLKKKIGAGDLKLKSYSYAWLWDGRPKNQTSYA